MRREKTVVDYGQYYQLAFNARHYCRKWWLSVEEGRRKAATGTPCKSTTRFSGCQVQGPSEKTGARRRGGQDEKEDKDQEKKGEQEKEGRVSGGGEAAGAGSSNSSTKRRKKTKAAGAKGEATSAAKGETARHKAAGLVAITRTFALGPLFCTVWGIKCSPPLTKNTTRRAKPSSTRFAGNAF